MVRDNYMPVRMNDDGRDRVAAIADAEFEGNQSAAMRRLIALGLEAWKLGARLPEQVAKKR